MILISCQSKEIQLTYDCSHSKLQKVRSEKEAIKVGIDYLNSTEQAKYIYKDSVKIFQNFNDSTFYEIGFLYKKRILPPHIILFIRKEDGCIHQPLLE